MSAKKRKNFSIKEKLQIIDQVKKSQSRSSVCRDNGIPESTLRGWLKDEEKIRQAVSDMDEPGQERKRFRGAKDQPLDKAVMTWFVQERSEGTPLSGPNIMHQALKFNKMLNPDDSTFQASNGWLRNFKNRHAIRQVNIHGEQRSTDDDAVESYPQELRQILTEGNYDREQIYNCNETALYFKMLPNKTLATKDDSTKTLGFKQDKNRLTALLCVNSSGTHKLKPLIIGKFQNPRCFHHVNRSTLPTDYNSSKNAWMTAAIFEDWFLEVFVPAVKRHMRKKKLQRKAILLVDNCAAHPANLKSRDGKIVVSFLPKNTTSKLQPLDMGIIATVKRNYRRNLVMGIIDSDVTLTQHVKKLTIKDAMHLFGQSWEEVSATSIRACWLKALASSLPIEDESDTEFDGFNEDDLRQAELRRDDYDNAQQALGGVTHSLIEEWLSTDSETPTSHSLTDEEIIISTSASTDTIEEDGDDDEEETEPKPPMTDVIKGLQAAVNWAERSANSTSLDVFHLNNILRRAKKEARESCRQLKLTDFFTQPR